MNSIKTTIALLVLLASTLACQSLSPKQTSTSNPLESDFPTTDAPENSSEDEFVVTEETVTEETDRLIEENFRDPGNPENYENICEYGDALIPYLPHKYYDLDYKEDGNTPMKAYSWVHGGMNQGCVSKKYGGEKPWYMRNFLTTWDKNEILNFYRDHFIAAGYVENEVEILFQNVIMFSEPGGHTIEFRVFDMGAKSPNDPSSKGIFDISFILRCCDE